MAEKSIGEWYLEADLEQAQEEIAHQTGVIESMEKFAQSQKRRIAGLWEERKRWAVLAAWLAGEISEGAAAETIGVDFEDMRVLRDHAVAVGMAERAAYLRARGLA